MWGKAPKSAPEPAAAPVSTPLPQAVPASPRPAPVAASVATIGKAIAIRGEVTGSEDLRIEGEVQGSVCLRGATVTVGTNGRVRADIEAREIAVEGSVEGNLVATERVCIGASGVVQGEVRTHRIAIEDGAILQGTVDIVKPGELRSAPAAKSFAAAASASASPSSSIEERTTSPVSVDTDGQ